MPAVPCRTLSSRRTRHCQSPEATGRSLKASELVAEAGAHRVDVGVDGGREADILVFKAGKEAGDQIDVDAETGRITEEETKKQTHGGTQSRADRKSAVTAGVIYTNEGLRV